MSNYRRNLLVNDKLSSYIADGLAFQLCGEDATSTNWIDRIGKKEFILSNCTLGNKCVCFNGTNSFGQSGVFGWNADTSTIEIVFKQNNANNFQLMFISPTANTIAFGAVSGKSCIWVSNNNTHSYPTITYNDKIKTVSINANLSYYNLNSVSKGGIDYWSNNGSHTYIGCRKEPNQDFFNGNIYQIRIYNRLLSAKEILYNQNIDFNKYGITI